MVKANTIDLATSGVVGFNGTGFVGSPATQYAVLTAGATSSSLTAVGTGTAGQILQSGGNASSPVYSTATYPSTATGTDKILIADGTNWVASTPTYPNAASTSGKVVVSNGTNFVTSTPTFPNASATSRKIIVSDGTNWVASTETYAVPGTSGKVLTSDGTNWVSSTPTNSSGMQSATVTVTNADLKAGNSSLLIAAQGSGKVIICYNVIWKFVYGGSNVFTNTPLNQINFGSTYNSGTILTNSGGASFWQASSNQYFTAVTGSTNLITAASTCENTGVYFTMSTGATGNAANDNTIIMQVQYLVLTI
jgi:hypothetical protein